MGGAPSPHARGGFHWTCLWALMLLCLTSLPPAQHPGRWGLTSWMEISGSPWPEYSAQGVPLLMGGGDPAAGWGTFLAPLSTSMSGHHVQGHPGGSNFQPLLTYTLCLCPPLPLPPCPAPKVSVPTLQGALQGLPLDAPSAIPAQVGSLRVDGFGPPLFWWSRGGSEHPVCPGPPPGSITR